MSKLVVFGSTSGVGASYIEYYHMREKTSIIGYSRSYSHSIEQDPICDHLPRLQKRYVDLTDMSSISLISKQLREDEVSRILLIAGAYPLTTDILSDRIENYKEMVLTHSIFYSELIDTIFSRTKDVSCLYISSTSVYWKGPHIGYSAAKAHAEQSLLSVAHKHICSTNRLNIARLTLMERPFASDNSQYTDQQYLKRVSLIPGGKAVAYNEINPTIEFLLSPSSSCINGNIIKLDRGESLRSS